MRHINQLKKISLRFVSALIMAAIIFVTLRGVPARAIGVFKPTIGNIAVPSVSTNNTKAVLINTTAPSALKAQATMNLGAGAQNVPLKNLEAAQLAQHPPALQSWFDAALKGLANAFGYMGKILIDTVQIGLRLVTSMLTPQLKLAPQTTAMPVAPVATANEKTKTWDPVTDARISQLDPRVQQSATNFINTAESEAGVQLRVVQGYRSTAEQNTLYAQGRTTPGSVVTNAKGGESYHNYGLAIDVVVMENGVPNWSQETTTDISAIGARNGFEWGGDWTGFKDYPHFQMTFGQTIKDLQNK